MERRFLIIMIASQLSYVDASQMDITISANEDQSVSKIAKSILNLINLYQKHSKKIVASFCPMYPSCSQYSKEAIIKYDLLGILMTFDRLHRCSHDLDKYQIIFVNGKLKYLDEID
tara:strand:- start:1410 stop:1757 length:348 start_codon:yes stop_codon:yes gene_type:complete